MLRRNRWFSPAVQRLFMKQNTRFSSRSNKKEENQDNEFLGESKNEAQESYPLFEPITTILSRSRVQKAISNGADIPENIPYKLRPSATWVSCDPTINFGINNNTNPTMRLIFEDPNTGEIRRFKYSSKILNKGLMFEIGCRIGTTYVSPPLLSDPIIYFGIPQTMTIGEGHSVSIGFAQIEVFNVLEYPDYSFTNVSIGFSFGVGYGAIQGGKIEFTHEHNATDKLREKLNFPVISAKLSRVVHIFWLFCFFTMSTSPVIVFLFD